MSSLIQDSNDERRTYGIGKNSTHQRYPRRSNPSSEYGTPSLYHNREINECNEKVDNDVESRCRAGSCGRRDTRALLTFSPVNPAAKD